MHLKTANKRKSLDKIEKIIYNNIDIVMIFKGVIGVGTKNR